MKTKILLTAFLLLSSLSNWAQLPSYIPANGLVAWYPFNGNANDESGNGNNASSIQAQLSSDRFNQNNKSFSFNGATDFIEIPHSSSFEFNNSISISAWINVAQLFQSGGAGFFPIISKSNQQFVYGTFAFGIWSPNLLAHFETQETGAPLQISFNEWQHVIVVISNGETKFYNNGNLIFSGPSGVFPNQYNSNLPIRIGNDRPGLVEYANGKIDDIGIWNRALTIQEINSLYTLQAPCQNTSSTISATITEGEAYSFNGQNLTTAGIYTATLQNTAGCDSIITLTLAANPVEQNCEVIISDNEICTGETVNISIGGYTPSTGTCSSENMPANLQQGLVAWYPFCGNAEDESPNNFNGTVRNATLTTDRFGNENQAYSFTTGQDIIVNGTQSLNLYPMSISLWYNVDTITSIYDEANIFSKYSPAAWNGYAIITSNMAPEENNVYYPTVKPWYTRSINNRIIGRYGSAPFEHENIDLDAWHHMVFTVAPDGGKCYVNGELIATDNWDGPAGPSSSSFIWKIGGLYEYWFKGKIDDIAVYNRVLTADEAVQLYQYQAESVTTSINWSTGETTPSISVSPTETTTYSVTVTQGTQTCTSEVTITVNQPSAETVNATITEGETYSFNGQNLTAAGTYTATLQNAAGCDSVVTLNLTVEPAVEPLNCEIGVERTNLCVGESSQLTISNSSNVNFTSNQQIQGLTFIGNFENSSYFIDNSNKTWTEANLNAIALGGKLLVINDSLEDAYISALLPAGYFHIGLFQNTSSQNYSEPNGGWEWVDGTPLVYTRWGVLPQEPNNEFGVENYGGIHGSNFPYYRGWNDGQIGFNPSIIELSLISPSSILWSTGETTPSISVSPTETTTYSVTVTQGTQTCTSEVTITVNQPSAETVNATITEGETYSFNGQNLTTAGTYTATLQNAAGCDSVVTLNLTVTPAPVGGCYAASVVNFSQGQRADATNVTAIRSNPELALGMPEPVVTNVVNFVSLGFGGSITLAFEAPIANGEGNDILINEATWGNNSCNNYPETADVFASQDGSNFVYLGRVCQDAELDLGQLSWAQYVRLVDVSDLLSFNADADGFDVNGIECLNGAATSLNDDGLVACSLQEIVSYTPGSRKNGTPVGAPRNNPNNTLGAPQNNNTINFTALGFGGTLVAKFDYVVFNQTGNDLRVTETSFGNPSCNNYPEKARVSVSMDNVNWTELGEICQDGEFDLGNVNYAQYIKIQDASPLSSNKFNGSADGYDVDAVMVLNNGCGTSSARLAQLDNTTTPDASMSISAFPNPMEDYTIVNFEGLENDADFNFQIMDAAGRVIRNNNIRVSTANPTYLFDASELARGIYQVLISNENGSYIIRLVK